MNDIAPTILKADRLSKQFGAVTVLSEITLDVRAGEIHAIIGENGAGKSTLMRLLSGYLSPSEGSTKHSGGQDAWQENSDADR
jgi:ribose transport system ATP-binding protein